MYLGDRHMANFAERARCGLLKLAPKAQIRNFSDSTQEKKLAGGVLAMRKCLPRRPQMTFHEHNSLSSGSCIMRNGKATCSSFLETSFVRSIMLSPVRKRMLPPHPSPPERRTIGVKQTIMWMWRLWLITPFAGEKDNTQTSVSSERRPRAFLLPI